MPRATSRFPKRRQWGTRFDAIHSLDSSSVTSDDAVTDKADDDMHISTNLSGSSDAPSALEEHSETDIAFQDTSFTQGNISWADDIVEESKDSRADEDLSRSTASQPSRSYNNTLRPRALPRWNHNASVFVASLPHLPNDELDGLVRDSLGKHGTIINVKFIHDLKSGYASNCAFVQFETPEQATAAIQACHMTYIHGRSIRCEPAKAHRTLLISFIPVPRRNNMSHSSNNSPNPSRSVPFAPEWVRLRRPEPRSRFVQVTFDDEALKYAEHDQPSWVATSEDRLQGAGALVSLNSDVSRKETIKVLAELIGPLEILRSFRIPPRDETQGFPYAPHPATGPDVTEESEDASTWEVKWDQRNDAVSALQTLHQIPIFVVTWAHEHPHPSHYHPRAFNPNVHQDRERTPNAAHQPKVFEAQDVHKPDAPRLAAPEGTSIGDVATTRPSVRIVVSLPTSATSRADLAAEDFPPLNGATDPATGLSVTEKIPKEWKGRSHDKSVVAPPPGLSTAVIDSVENLFVPPQADNVGESAIVYAEDRETDNEGHGSPLPPSPETPSSLRYSPLATPSTVGPATPSPVTFTNHIPGDTIFVGGLYRSYGWSEAQLAEIFGRYGEVSSVKLLFRPRLESPGHAFIRFVDPSVVAVAVAGEHDRLYGGKSIRVKISHGNFKRFSHWKRNPSVEGLGLQGIESNSSHVEGLQQPGIASPERMFSVVDETIISQPPVEDIEVTDIVHSPDVTVRSPEPSQAHESPVVPPVRQGSSPKSMLKTSASLHPAEMRKFRDSRPSPPTSRRTRAKSDPATPSAILRSSSEVDQTSSQQSYSSPDPYVPYAPTAMMFVPSHGPPVLPPEMTHFAQLYPGWRHPASQVPQMNVFAPATYVPYSPNGIPSPQSSSPAPLQPQHQPPFQAAGYIQGENGIFIPVYKNDRTVEQVSLMPTATMTVPIDLAQSWSERQAYSPPAWLPQQALTPQPVPLGLPVHQPPEWDSSRTFANNPQHHGHPMFVRPAYPGLAPHHLTPTLSPASLPSPSHPPRVGPNGPRHSRPQRVSSNNIDAGGSGSSAGSNHGPTLQQMIDSNKKQDSRYSRTPSSRQPPNVANPKVPNAVYPSYPVPYDLMHPINPYYLQQQALKMTPTTQMTVPAQWTALPAAYENA